MPQSNSTQGPPVNVLLAGEFAADKLVVNRVFQKPGWRLFEARGKRQALRVLEQNDVHVVVAEAGLPNWRWKSVLSDLRRFANPPQLVVASRHADDHLWSEVLNLGAFDLLSQPFRTEEVERVIASAHRHYQPAAAWSVAAG